VKLLTPSKEQLESAISLYSNGKINEAIDAINTLIDSHPENPLLFNILGACFKKLGKIDTAAKMFNTAVTLKPDYAEAHFNHAIALNETGKTDLSAESYKKAITILPNYPDAHNNLGNIYLDSNRYQEALKHFEAAVFYKPEFSKAYNNLGVANRELEQINNAVENFKKAIVINPRYTKAILNLGNVHKDLGEVKDAEKCFEQALTNEPDNAQAHVSLGTFFKEKGQVKDAIKSFKRAIQINPSYGVAYFNLTLMRESKIEKKLISQMLSQLSTNNLSQSDRIDFCFALAITYEKLEKYDDFFKFLNEGNRLRKEELNYSLGRSQGTINLVKKIFSSLPSNNKKSLPFKTSSIRPIFLVGMPRSGSTLVEQILSSHANVHGAGEIQYLRKILAPIIEKYEKNDSKSIGKKKKISDEDYLSIRHQYLELLTRFNTPKNVIVDKSLLNYRFIGIILKALPEAKIIHLKRDARAICWSIYKNNFPQSGIGFGNNMKDLTGYYISYCEMMAFWHEKFPNKIYDLNYENLTTSQEEETKNLLEYCALEWDDNCLNFHTNKRTVKTASALQVRKKIYQGSSEAWKKYETYLEQLIKPLNSH
jgi:tetratricopeptide (TPR) repeat protein